VEVYEYDVYGRVGMADANHPNRFMFTGREFDKETGLYYYRARYYTPQIGRFLQTDSVGYGAGMNLYVYCANNPAGFVDPSGFAWEDPNLKILFVNKATWINTVDYDYWDIVFDISTVKSVDDITSDLSQVRKIAEAHGKDWNQVTIDGVWFLDHGDWFDGTKGQEVDANQCMQQVGQISLVSGTNATTQFFSSLGKALDDMVDDNGCKKATGAEIHLRGCGSGREMPDGSGTRPLIEQAAKYSGHTVTGAQGMVYPNDNPLIRANYYCPTGYYYATPDGHKGKYYGDYCYWSPASNRWVWSNSNTSCF
jgi:RHS repeat-associated protein